MIDGDTLEVPAHVWLGQRITTLVRLAGADAPELRSRCAAERQLAERATRFVASAIAGGGVRLHDVRHGKFAGRILARVEAASGADLARTLLAAVLARPYAGGRRADWCAGAAAPNAARR